ncbi:energy transducer TonB [uncultured Desulfobacter sp.]|uniref:energy transducer TonB n=1 Tax=uncultured Desulfobacter sp. TaxID=240139 RepID=UPI0029F4C00F|nr:energy transducer TonB [uncultured Desulfobacter sp.]
MKLSYQQSYLVQGVLGAMIINLALFGLLPGLIHMETRPGDLESLNVVTFTRFKPQPIEPEPEKKEEMKEEEPPEEIHKIVHHEHLNVPKQQLKMEMPRLDLNIDPRLSSDIHMVSSGKSGPVGTGAGPDFSSIMDMDAVDTIPVPRFKAAPRYPYRAKRMGREGTVKIRFLVDKEGYVSDIRILDAKPPGFFEEAVLDAVSTWKYAPGELMGRKVKTLVTTSVVFKLEN